MNYCDGIKDEYVWADDGHIRQIITNLLSNAIKYTPNGGEIHHIVKQLPCDTDGYGRYQIIVEDNGKGMSEEFLSRIYGEFEREKSSTESGTQGTGLGMAIVKKLVDAMNGEIDIESRLNEGTCVTVTLELKHASDEEIRQHLSEQETKKELSREALKGKRILLVEDNDMNREIARELLEEAGMLVEEADDGDTAVEILKGIVKRGEPTYFDAVLMDMQMPRMNGYEATKAIREIPDPSNVHLPIIALSANAFDEDKKKSAEAGMDGHIAKPIRTQELFDILSELL